MIGTDQQIAALLRRSWDVPNGSRDAATRLLAIAVHEPKPHVRAPLARWLWLAGGGSIAAGLAAVLAFGVPTQLAGQRGVSTAQSVKQSTAVATTTTAKTPSDEDMLTLFSLDTASTDTEETLI